MIKYLILSASFSAVTLGSYVFLRGDNLDISPVVLNSEFVNASLETVRPQPVLLAVEEPQFPQAVQPEAINTQIGTPFTVVVATPDIKTPSPRPTSVHQVDVGDARANLDEATFNALRTIEEATNIGVNTTRNPVAQLDIQRIVARSLAQPQENSYVAEINQEAQDTRIVEAPKETMFANTLISNTSRPTVSVLQTANTEDAAYLTQLNETSAPPKRLAHTKKYTVKRGDNLSRISYIHYGRTSDYITIFQANRDRLKNPNRILVGQKLIIPAL